MVPYPPIFILATLVLSTVSSNDFNDLNHLGERISKQIRNELKPLQNLGSQINADVEEQLRGEYYGSQMSDLGSRISSSIQSGLAPLQNLGQQIQQNVQHGLEPVRGMELMFAMKGGVGGITIATHSPSGKQFIFKNRNPYQCEGTITATGQCDGNLTPYSTKAETDYCYIRNRYSVFNDYVCIGASSIQIINNNVQCKNYDNSPVLVMKREEFEKMCQTLSQNVEYKYIADPTNPMHVKIPNPNKYVRCSNNEPNVCIFTEPNNVSGTTIIYNQYN